MSIPKLDAKSARALQVIRAAPELAPFLNYLRLRRDAHRDALETSPNERITARHQGAAEELKTLLTEIEQANTTYLKLTATPPR